MIVLNGPAERLDGVVLSADGRFAATAGVRAPLWLWDLVAGSRLPLAADVVPQSRNAYDFSPDGRWLAVAGSRGLSLFDTSTGRATVTVEFRRPWQAAEAVRFLSARRLVAATEGFGKFDGDLTVFDVRGGRLGPGRVTADNLGPVTALALTPDRRTLVTHAAEWLDVWDARTMRQRAHWPLGAIRDRPVVVSLDGTLVVLFRRTFVHVLDATGGRDAAVVSGAGRRWVQAAAFTPDGRSLAVVGGSDAVRFFDTTTWRERTAFAWGVGELRGVAFTADGLRGVACSATGRVVVWDM